MRIYLDVCCLNRLFDDLSQDRVRLESESILSVLNRCQLGKWVLVGSEVVFFEIDKIPHKDRRSKVHFLASIAQLVIKIEDNIEKRAIELEKIGLGSFDALHISCAEKGKVDIFLTTDDVLIRKAKSNSDQIKVKIENPIKWLAEEIYK
jgi:predicted nucleic acid-binding protein